MESANSDIGLLFNDLYIKYIFKIYYSLKNQLKLSQKLYSIYNLKNSVNALFI